MTLDLEAVERLRPKLYGAQLDHLVDRFNLNLIHRSSGFMGESARDCFSVQPKLKCRKSLSPRLLLEKSQMKFLLLGAFLQHSTKQLVKLQFVESPKMSNGCEKILFTPFSI